MSSKSASEKIPADLLKSEIQAKFGSLKEWSERHNIHRLILHRLLYRRPPYVFQGTATIRAIKAIESDFGITPEQLGIQVLEVER